MGIVQFGAPKNLILHIQSEFNISTFVESGAYLGETATWAAEHFERVVTIEFSQQMHQKAQGKLNGQTNVELYFGDSQKILPEIISNISSPGIFWLDAHWSGSETYGENDECPLLAEIEVIRSMSEPQFILIDDARLFLSPPPWPHSAAQWPTIKDVIDAIYINSPDYYVVVFRDVIIAVPQYAKPFMADYCQSLNTDEWLAYNKMRTNKLSKLKWGLGMVKDGLYLTSSGLVSEIRKMLEKRK